MIEEQYVSFDTARMLKEAGFDVPCTSQYTEGMGVWNVEYPYNFNKDELGYSRPTQALAARWLREVHGIHVFSMRLPKGTWLPWFEHFTGDGKYKKYTSKDTFDSYEQSIEVGSREAIKLIKK